jgi:hypothetical protein
MNGWIEEELNKFSNLPQNMSMAHKASFVSKMLEGQGVQNATNIF